MSTKRYHFQLMNGRKVVADTVCTFGWAGAGSAIVMTARSGSVSISMVSGCAAAIPQLESRSENRRTTAISIFVCFITRSSSL